MLKIVRIGSNRKAQQQDPVFTLVAGRKYSVGRKGCDLCFEDDMSISRRHAEIEVEHPIGNVVNPLLPPSISVTDLGSKFGTFVNNGIETKSKISLREGQVLEAGDRFRFGCQWNEYRIDYRVMIVTSSGLRDSIGLKDRLSCLGGHLVSEWRQESEFLVMESITLTIKVVLALLSAKPIVTPVFFDVYLSTVQNSISSIGDVKFDVPDPKDYLPPLIERTLLGQDNLFHPDSRRNRLFSGQLFLFYDARTLKTYGPAFKSGGGDVATLLSVSPGILKDPNTVLVGHEEDFQDNDFRAQTALEAYTITKKRLVAESEVGLAVIHMDTSVYCNPMASLPSKLNTPFKSSQSEGNICPETKDLPLHCTNTQSLHEISRIPETQTLKREAEDDGPSGSKRILVGATQSEGIFGDSGISGICPPSQNYSGSESSTFSTPQRQLEKEISLDSNPLKRKQTEVCIEGEAEAVELKRLKILQDGNGPKIKQEVKQVQENKVIGEGIEPMGFSFVSLVVQRGTRQGDMRIPEEDTGVSLKNFKTFRKVLLGFVPRPSVKITFIDDQVEKTDWFVDSEKMEMEQGQSGSKLPPTKRVKVSEKEGKNVDEVDEVKVDEVEVDEEEEPDEFAFL